MKVIMKLLAGVVVILLTVTSATAQKLPVGASSFQVDAPRGPVTIYTYKPENFGPQSPVWVIAHGVGRTASTYYDAWLPFAKRYGAMLIVPFFSKEKWGRSWRYALGNVSTSTLLKLPRRDWAFTVIQKAFDYAVAAESTGQKRFYLYGHSAGGQFTHRYVMYTGGEKIKMAVSANSGWYILPDNKYVYPYGFKRVPVGQHTLRRAFATPMVVLVGERDINWSKGLRRNVYTKIQGPHRLARGKFFYEYSKRAAAHKGHAYRWHFQTVPGAGHRNKQMAPAAAAIFARAHGLQVTH